MTCSDCQAQIFDGELDHGALAHLTGCEECRALDQEVRLNAEALASMRADVIPARRARRWPGVVAAVAAALIAAVAVSYEPVRVPEPRVPMAVLPQDPPPAADPVLPVASRPAKKAVAARRKPPATAQPVEEPLLVKFLTDDPDVVIYWLIDPKQGEQVL